MSEKLNYYLSRTVEHIHRVQNNMMKLCRDHRETLGLSDEDVRICMHNVMKHDQSKFSPEQFQPYIELTEYYRQRKALKNKDYDYQLGVRELVDKAVEHHYQNENHHPERIKGLCAKWGIHEAVETACDLQAMAQEFDEGTCRKYWEEKWKPTHANSFYDDYNWYHVEAWMNLAITCFEQDLNFQVQESK